MKYAGSIELETDTKIKELDQEKTYKYLSIEEGDGIQHGKIYNLQSKLNAKNKLEAINTLAIPVVTFNFNVVNWNLEEIKRKNPRKMMTLNRMHHPQGRYE